MTEKVKAIMLTKHDNQTVGSEFNFSGRAIYSSAKVDFLGIKLDIKLSFESQKCVRKQLDNQMP